MALAFICLSQVGFGRLGRRDENSCWEVKDLWDDKEITDLF